MLYHLIFPAVAPCQDSSIRVGGWLSVRNGKPYSLLSLPFEFFRALLCLPGLRCPAGFSNGGSRQLRLLIWFPCFSAGFMEGDQAHYLLCILSTHTQGWSRQTNTFSRVICARGRHYRNRRIFLQLLCPWRNGFQFSSLCITRNAIKQALSLPL